MKNARTRLTLREMTVFALLGVILYLSKRLMEWAPNLHFVGMFTITYTLVYRCRALIPLYLAILLDGLFAGFALWWLPYLYIWTVLWGAVMLLPRHMPVKVAAPVYTVLCGLHGLAFGTLYAPAQALLFGLDLPAMWAWIVAGLPFDALHALGNLCAGTLILPLTLLLCRLEHIPFPFTRTSP